MSSTLTSTICEQDQGHTLLVFSWVLASIAVVTVILRLYVRKYSLQHDMTGWDDYIIVFAVLNHLATNSFLTVWISYGLGRHVACLSLAQVFQTLKWSVLAQKILGIGIGFTKISVCLLVMRIIDRTRKWITRFFQAFIVFIALSHLAELFLYVLQCRPMAKIWNPTLEGHCFSNHTTYLYIYIIYGVDVFTDMVCAIIPVFVIMKLQMDRRTKPALCLLMSGGLFTAGCALADDIFLNGVFSRDFTWDLTRTARWAVVVAYLGTIIASLSAFWPLLRRLHDTTKSLYSSKRSSERSQASSIPRSHALDVDIRLPELPAELPHLRLLDSPQRIIPAPQSVVTITNWIGDAVGHDLEAGKGNSYHRP